MDMFARKRNQRRSNTEQEDKKEILRIKLRFRQSDKWEKILLLRETVRIYVKLQGGKNVSVKNYYLHTFILGL